MAVNPSKLWKKARTTADEAESVRTLAKILSSKDGRSFISNLEPSEAELCIEILDHGLAGHRLGAPEKQVFFGTLWELAGKHARLPGSMVITENIDFSASSQHYTSGGFADIKPGQYKGCTVAVKTLRVAMSDNFDKIRKQFYREAILWNSLSHPNILKFVGVLGGIEQYQFATVSEWMMHGNIMEYIRKNATNRLKLLNDAAEGLRYLHGANLAHGDLKGANILMTNDAPPKACLADFGLMTMVFNPQNPMSSSLTLEGGTMPFAAPELLAPSKFGLKNAVPTQEGDIYAFGLVILQVLTGKKPFHNIKPLELAYRVSSGVRPEKPANAAAIGISDALWKLIQKCWDGQRTRRPRIQEVVTRVGDAAANWHTDMPPSGTRHREDSVVEEDSDEVKHVAIFEPYLGGAAPTQPAGVEIHEEGSVVEASGVGKAIRQQTKQPEMPGAKPPAPAVKISRAASSLRMIADWDGNTQCINQVVTGAFETDGYLDCIKDLKAQNIDPLSYINSLDKIIDSLPTNSNLRRQCIRALRKTCGLHGVLPSSYIVTFTLSEPSRRPFSSSGFADVWKLTNEEHHDRVFAAKSLRVCEQDHVEKIKKKFCKDVVVSKRASHPNILSIEGVAPMLFEFCMVSEWMPNGDVLEYIAKHPEANRLKLLVGIVRGLDYLHRNEVIHGYLESSHILMDAKDSPRLFNFCSIKGSIDSISASAIDRDCAIRYCAPELFDLGGTERVEKRKPTNKSDVYSLSMVIVGLVTGKMPFPECTDSRVTILISKGKRPPKPRRFEAPGMTRAVWKIAKKCWHGKARERPEVNAVLQHLENLANHSPDDRIVPTPRNQRLWEMFEA